MSLAREIITQVEGTSMRPLLPGGCRLIATRATAAELKIGDIALFRRGKTLVAHRVAAIARSENFVSVAERGDNAPKSYIRGGSEVVGKVAAIDYGRGFAPLSCLLSRAVSRAFGYDSPLRLIPLFSSEPCLRAFEKALELASALFCSRRRAQ